MNPDELQRKAELDAREAVRLFDVQLPERDKVFLILSKLRSSMAAMQTLEREIIGCGGKVG